MPQTSRTLSPHLQKMKLEMELRGLSPQTLQHYLSHLRLLEKYFSKPVFEVSPDELKQYLYYRIKFGISYSSINISCSAFKIFFNKVLNYNWSDDVIVRPRRPKGLPYVLSQKEILSIIDQVSNLKHKTRKSHWLNNLKSGHLRIDLAQIQDSNALVGYCVTKIIADLGEIESLYVDEPFRKMGIGNCLITRALNWLNSRSVKTKRVNVAVGNEQVLRFYGRYGFLSRSITLEQKL
jgi:ribosomal protein S18 acetylase RimI-like enzyme